jgi:hypothetical protein
MGSMTRQKALSSLRSSSFSSLPITTAERYISQRSTGIT